MEHNCLVLSITFKFSSIIISAVITADSLLI